MTYGCIKDHQHKWFVAALVCSLTGWFYCKHTDLLFVHNMSSDEINATGNRSAWGCRKCGRWVYKKEWYNNPSIHVETLANDAVPTPANDALPTHLL